MNKKEYNMRKRTLHIYSKKLQYNGGNSNVSAFYRALEDQASHMEKNRPDRRGFKYDFPGGSSGSRENGLVKDQDRLLPIANVSRIMKRILPPSAKVSKEAKETMQECVSEFVSFVTIEASDKCRNAKRKTLNGDDVCSAMEVLGFDDYAEPLKKYLLKYREVEEGRAKSKIENEEEEEYKSQNFH